jgi:hypothetical protein
MRLITPESVWNLQKSLAAKAKGSPIFRFYSLYDKICRRDVLHCLATRPCQRWQCRRGRTNLRARSRRRFGSGLDGLTEQPERRRTSRKPCDGVHPKGRRQTRPLGIRAWQIGWCRWQPPWCSAPSSRRTCPKNSTPTERPQRHDALRAVHGLVHRGYRDVVDADLSGYFDTIPTTSC